MNNGSRSGDAGRRAFLLQVTRLGAGGLVAASALARAADAVLPIGNGVRPLVKYPQKRPLLRLTSRPVHLARG